MNEKVSLKNLLPMVAAIGIPVALQNLLTTTGSMVDTVMLASLGEKTVGAVGLCAQFSTLLFAGYWGFVGGGMLFFSQFYGAGNHDGIKRSYGMTISCMMISGVIFTALALVFPKFVMSVYTDSKDIQEIGVQYLRVVGISYPLQVVAMAMSALLRSTEKVKIPLYGGIAAVITNFVCNFILIFGRFGLPRMGVRGAACGTVIASIVNIAVIVIWCLKQKNPYIFAIREHFQWNKALFKDYIKKCYPIIMNEVMIGIGNMMINIVLGHQADEAIAATAVFRTLEGIIISFFSGFSSAATVLVGKEVGAGFHERAFERAWRIVYVCSALTGSACLVLIVIHDPLLHVMGLTGLSFRLATGMLLIYSVAAILRMGNWAQNDTYRSAGDPAFGSILEITFMFLLAQPAIHLANDVLRLPFLAVFALCYVDEPIRYVIMQRHMYSRKWIRPVSAAGKATIEAFRQKYNVRI